MEFSRRRALELTALGFGRVVLSHLMAEETAASPSIPIYNDISSRPGHFPAKAKAVIQLVQNGGPSQMDLFDPKPLLAKYAGQPHPDGVEIHQPGNKNTLLPTPFSFSKYGQCGMDVSEAKRLKQLEDENAKLKKLLAEQMLDAAAMRELLSKKW